ncbi:flagellar brake protein [Cellvibrio sp. pealriver]|uniref:flagellar brake protein n=1 Tax=Cellvibrio sp. pealriver TaxID=1622269 RepID=UPI00066FCF6A|nr:PilZ domain-containing protein [Cellvibrio sp. pealriver]
MSLFSKLFRKNTHKNPDKGIGAENSGSDTESTPIPSQYIPLAELQKQRQQLEVKITGASRTYQTMILAIDIERGLLWLDDLFPQQLILDVGDDITIRHHRNGEQLVIQAAIVALGSTYGASGLAITLPESASYQPRRSSPRFMIGHQSPLSVKIRPLGQEPCYGTLQDISAGGLRVMVAGNLIPYLRHGALLPLCEVNISDELQIRCRARICAFRIGRSPYRHTQISIKFVDLEEETRDSLARFLQESDLGQANQTWDSYAA